LYLIGRTWRGTAVAEFSGVAFTGSVSEPWQVTDPGWGNSPDDLYAALEDAAGRMAVEVNPDPGAVNVADWTQWRIPLKEFTGADVTSIKKMYIGVGDGDNPQPNGTGRIYIDDICVVRSAPTE